MTDPLIGRTLGPYRIQLLLGLGGMGRVYQAYYREHPVALKVLDLAQSPSPGLVRRFRQEIELAERLRHHNIVRVYGGGQQGNYLYLAMEYIEGGSLRDYLEQHGRRPLAVPDALRITRQICTALEYAHRKGVVHRDVKPGNILLRRDGRAMLADFGVAQILSGRGAGLERNRPVGTAAYLAPEQALGKESSNRSDVYALGAVLYEMLTGSPPFRADSQEVLLYKHVHETPSRLEDGSGYIPAQLRSVLRKAMAKESERRYPNAQSLGRALERAMSQLSIIPLAAPSREKEAAPISPPRWSGRSRRRPWAALAIVCGVLLLATMAVGVFVWPRTGLSFLPLSSPAPSASSPAPSSPSPAQPTAAPPTATIPTTAPPKATTARPSLPPPTTLAATAAPNRAQTQYAQKTLTAAALPVQTSRPPEASPTATPSNQAPVIHEIHSPSSSVRVTGDNLRMVCDAWDPDGDPLTYTWYAADLLNPVQAGSSSEYLFDPEELGLTAGPCTIRVVVSDGQAQVEATKVITILADSPLFFVDAPEANVASLEEALGREIQGRQPSKTGPGELSGNYKAA